MREHRRADRRALVLQEKLLRWHRAHPRTLPWQGTSDPWKIWVSEVMLQQTRVETVIPYYLRFLRRFPTPADLARAPLQDALKLWEGLGYYARVRNLWRAVRQIQRLPQSLTEWKRLPGIGETTARAIVTLAGQGCYLIPDANVQRVLGRLAGRREAHGSSGLRRALEEVFRNLHPVHRDCRELAEALLHLGQTVCLPRGPRCHLCPWNEECKARASGNPERFPGKRRKTHKRPVEVVAALIVRGDRILITQRPPEGLLGGLWEFPGGKVEDGESLEDALRREIREELNLDVEPLRRLMVIRHQYTHLDVRLHFFLCAVRGGEFRPGAGVAGHAWVSTSELDQYAFPAADRRFLQYLKEKGLPHIMTSEGL